MGKYTIIAEIGNYIISTLRENLVPDIIQNENSIGMCLPSDKGDLRLGVYLYDVRNSAEVIFNGMVDVNESTQKYPSTFLNLYYMVTPYSYSDIKFRALEEHRVLGRVVQIFSDSYFLNKSSIANGGEEFELRIEVQDLSLEDKFRIWNLSSESYRASAFLKVYPVEIESTKTKHVQRISELEFRAEE